MSKAAGLKPQKGGVDMPGRSMFDFEQPADAMRQHAGLAGTGAGEHEVMPYRCADGLTLRRVEVVEQMRNIHRSIVTARRRFMSR